MTGDRVATNMTVHQIRGRPQTMHDLLRARADVNPDLDPFVDRDRRITFRAWDAAADAVAVGPAGHGVGPGDVGCRELPSAIEYALRQQARARRGAHTAGTHPR